MSDEELAYLVLIVSGIIASLCICFVFLSYFGTRAFESDVSAGKVDRSFIKDEILSRRKAGQSLTAWSVLAQIFYCSVVAIFVAIISFAISEKINGNHLQNGQSSTIVIESNSMASKNEANSYLASYDNQFSRGDLIVVTAPSSQDSIKQYDIIAYVRPSDSTIIVHRVKEIREETDGIHYLTRGDANNASDAYLPTYSDIIGVYDYNIKYMGWPTLFVQSPFGIATIIGLLLVWGMAAWAIEDYWTIRDSREGSVKSLAFNKPSTGMAHSRINAVYQEYCQEETLLIDKKSRR